jgi:hypothetical protein
MEAIWFAALFSSICLEGLGRRYLPNIPSMAFYFLKDGILLLGYLLFRPSPLVTRTVRLLYGGFVIALLAGLVWTILEALNPTQTSLVLALFGLRAYWLWWIAPVIIAQALSKARNKRYAVYVLLVMSVGIAVLAAFQFVASPTSALNLYTVQDGEEVYAGDVAVVSSTGRARVASTFSFLSGFEDFTVLVPALLLALGLEAKEVRLRNAAFIATLATAAVLPMSGSRTSVLLGATVLLVAAWTSGLLFTRIGRRVMIGGALAAVLSVSLFPEAFVGVQSRFQNEGEIQYRLYETLQAYLPPMAIVRTDVPLMGVGTGTQQNAHLSMRVALDWHQESETARYLVELGPFGFLLIWFGKLGLMIALLRAARILKRVGRRGAAAAATSYAVLTFSGNLTFDHVWQALYFVGCGFILSEVVAARAQAATRSSVVAERPAVALPAAGAAYSASDAR